MAAFGREKKSIELEVDSTKFMEAVKELEAKLAELEERVVMLSNALERASTALKSTTRAMEKSASSLRVAQIKKR